MQDTNQVFEFLGVYNDSGPPIQNGDTVEAVKLQLVGRGVVGSTVIFLDDGYPMGSTVVQDHGYWFVGVYVVPHTYRFAARERGNKISPVWKVTVIRPT